MSNKTPVIINSELKSYFDRKPLHVKNCIENVNPQAKPTHIMAVRKIIEKDEKDISQIELLSCDKIMCYYPEQYTLSQRQKCYDLVVKNIPFQNSSVISRIDGVFNTEPIVNENLLNNGFYRVMCSAAYLDTYLFM